MEKGSIRDAIASRRSIRRFTKEPVDAGELVSILQVAFFAPAPHHTIPWRFAVVVDEAAKRRLAESMAARWREDMRRDGIDPKRSSVLSDKSIQKLTNAPALILACLVTQGLDTYPDRRRQDAELGMALLSLGAAIQNIMLAAAEAGYGSCWIAAPIFAPEEARESLQLPSEWIPQALLIIGRPDPCYIPRSRPDLDLDSFVSVI
ncbi:MAG: nitroreductase [Acidimicrobiia bacterium]